MFPGSVLSLLLTVFVLVPGAAYSITYRRRRPGQSIGEATGAFIIAGALFGGVALLILTLGDETWAGRWIVGIPDLVGAGAEQYVRLNFLAVLLTAVVFLTFASAIAWCAARFTATRAARGAGHHPSTDVWWKLFSLDREASGDHVEIVVCLTDNSVVAGQVKNWTTEARGSAPRELVLYPWRLHGYQNSMQPAELLDLEPKEIAWEERVVIADSQIKAFHLRYVPSAEVQQLKRLLDTWARHRSDMRERKGESRLGFEADSGTWTYRCGQDRLITLLLGPGLCRIWHANSVQSPHTSRSSNARSLLAAAGGKSHCKFVELKAAELVRGDGWTIASMEEAVLDVLLDQSLR